MKYSEKKIHSVSFPLEISQNSQENTCAGASFLIKLQASGYNNFMRIFFGGFKFNN